MKPFALLLSTFVVLMSCIPVRIETTPKSVILTERGKKVTANHTSLVSVRSFVNTSKTRVWIDDVVGVSCTIRSSNYYLNFVTPAKIVLPTYGDLTPAPKITCIYDGETVVDSSACYVLKSQKKPNVCEHSDFSLIFKRFQRK